MDSRTKAILEATIREYIETGAPVSSRQLATRHGFDVRSATIRNELNRLTQEGFLAQPHTSGGRIPTDKGYRFLVERLLKERQESTSHNVRKASDATALTRELAHGRFERFVQDIADDFNLLSVGYGSSNQMVYKRGLDVLFDQIAAYRDIESLRELAQIVSDFEALDSRMQHLLTAVTGNEPTVFIGRSPITRSEHLSVIAERFTCDGQPFIAAIIGPKRMDYGTVINVFSQVRRAMENE